MNDAPIPAFDLARELLRGVNIEDDESRRLADKIGFAIIQERRDQQDRDAKIADEVERQQDDDNGAANTGGAAQVADAIRRGSS